MALALKADPFRNGSFATKSADFAGQLMSAFLRVRPKCCFAAKRREELEIDIDHEWRLSQRGS
jgi:hypothetical protein